MIAQMLRFFDETTLETVSVHLYIQTARLIYRRASRGSWSAGLLAPLLCGGRAFHGRRLCPSTASCRLDAAAGQQPEEAQGAFAGLSPQDQTTQDPLSR